MVFSKANEKFDSVFFKAETNNVIYYSLLNDEKIRSKSLVLEPGAQIESHTTDTF